jgi:Holliday junction resolvase-like predicted endonuclease
LGEIDIVAEHVGTQVFVEVKARSGIAFGAPRVTVYARAFDRAASP